MQAWKLVGQSWKMRGLGLGAAVMMGVLSGCVGYASFPYEEGGKNNFATQDPNTPPADELMALSLDWVVSKYPPRGAGAPGTATDPSYTINVPKGVRRDVYDKILDKLGGKAAPLTPETAGTMPIYHIGRIWIRGREAKVDVLRPVLEGPRGPGGAVLYQPVTLRIEGGFEPWRVRRHQVWEVGTVPVPDLYYRPEYDDARRQYHQEARMPATRPVVAAPEPRDGIRREPRPVMEEASEAGTGAEDASEQAFIEEMVNWSGAPAGMVRRYPSEGRPVGQMAGR